VSRVIAGCGGVLALLIATLFTGGLALSAPIGMAVAAAIARRRHDALSRGASWLGAVLAVGAVLIVIGSVVVASAPTGTFAQIQHSADSASATAKPPAWLERVAPGASAPGAQVRPHGAWGGAFSIWTMVTGGLIGCAILAALIGTLGWLASLPLAYAITGGWLGADGSRRTIA
jgi:hypothetical protein